MSRRLAVLVLVLAAARPAGAERLALVHLVVSDGTDAERVAVRATVEQALRKGGAEVVEPSELVLSAELATRQGCVQDDRCRAELGAQLAADVLVMGRIAKEDEAWVARLSTFDVGLDTFTARDQVACARCGPKLLEQRLGQLVSSLLKAHRAFGRGTLIVHSRPAGAEVQLDQRRVGVTDLELTVAAGAHTVEVLRDGGATVVLAVEVASHERKLLELELRPAKPASTHLVPRVAAVLPTISHPAGSDQHHGRLWLQILGGVALSGGVALAATGVGLLVEDGRGACELAAGSRQCAALTDSRGAGLGWLIPGAILVAGGVAMLAVGTQRRRVAR